MTNPSAPLEQFYDLRRLSEAGVEIKIDADAAARERLAVWLNIDSVKSLNATVTLKRKSPNRFAYEAFFVCDVVQLSVVSLQPVEAHIDENVIREVHLNERGRHAAEKELTLAAGDGESPEEINSPHYDLVAPILEELSLALDPYPRVPGELFAEPDPEAAGKISPFAVLKKLKKRG